MKKSKSLILSIMLVSTLASCKKDFSIDKSVQSINFQQGSMFRTYTDKEIGDNMIKIKNVFKDLYHDNSNIKVVNAAIFSQAYVDECVLLKDLILLKPAG